MSDAEELVKLARHLERLMMRRRKAAKLHAELTAEIRRTKHFIRDLAGTAWSVAAERSPEPGEQDALALEEPDATR